MGLTREAKILLALSLGDGYIKKDNRYNSYTLCISHCVKQFEYIKYKAKLISDITGDTVIPKYINNNGYGGYIFYKCIPILKFIKDILYPSGKKTISLPLLKELDDEGVAIWYMDDGSLNPKKHNGKIHGYELRIATYCTIEEAKDCITFFKERYDINFTYVFNKDKYYIRCGTLSARIFLKKLEPYIIGLMDYKLFPTGEV